MEKLVRDRSLGLMLCCGCILSKGNLSQRLSTPQIVPRLISGKRCIL